MSSAQVVSTADVTSLDDDCRVKEDVCQKSDSTEIVKEDSSVSESFYSDSSVDEEIKRKPLCDHFKRGKCRLENSCRFVHSLKEHNDPSLITKRRAEAKAQHKLLKLRNREAEKSDTQLTSAGDTDSPCYSATTEYYDHPQQRDVVPPTTTGVRRSASCSMVQTPTFQGSSMNSEEHYEE
ncbi:hypothetical protein Pmar_PMAR023209 [Perkinsus marinus ATCC 50983]|uniref:C3H1-type domain-containing protein n=1 Tax=Perkinsus marinus (strain ATCC 50983 / TXsc) TaxID=423536 RepID=C5LJG8_PERM5|nr:hypothetical protein Pmar_PMAR023209 [Perkinsus marinus ATCC 50983]EER03097.1 hypothetical protein Pmar_PMAR023209 [Perkinsus marinus ATCC 50983]|eukprot:XP_002771281.1 hypothetical protein Pmar_PMAR023209 [Perkinsus marinus ATCC 50983]